MVPASIQKLLIAGAALETFGAGHVFTTTVCYSGTIDEEGVLRGNVIIEGGGDPALGSDRFKNHYGDIVERISAAVAQAGITEIDGKIIADASIFGRPEIPDTWIWEDIGNYYGSPAFGLNILGNTYRLTFASGAPGERTTISGVEPNLPGITFQNYVVAAPNNRDNAYIYGSYMSATREIYGTIPVNRSRFSIKGSIPNPPLLIATMLTEKLFQKGIHIADEPDVIWSAADSRKSTTLLKIQSPPLAEIVKKLNMKSINLYAEALLLHLARANGENVSVDEGCRQLTKFWATKGMDTTGLFLQDASGLSRANGIAPSQLAFLLDYMKNYSRDAQSFTASLPVAGESGSLANVFTSVKGKFSAKSGYMSRVLNYAGYLETKTGQNLIVVLMVNNYTSSTTEMRRLWEELLKEVYESDFS